MRIPILPEIQRIYQLYFFYQTAFSNFEEPYALLCISFLHVKHWHDDVMSWKRFPHTSAYYFFVHQSHVYSPHNGPVMRWCVALVFSLFYPEQAVDKHCNYCWFETPWRQCNVINDQTACGTVCSLLNHSACKYPWPFLRCAIIMLSEIVVVPLRCLKLVSLYIWMACLLYATMYTNVLSNSEQVPLGLQGHSFFLRQKLDSNGPVINLGIGHESDGVSNHRPLHYLFSCFFISTSKRTSELRITCDRWFPLSNEPLMRKAVPCHDIIIDA